LRRREPAGEARWLWKKRSLYSDLKIVAPLPRSESMASPAPEGGSWEEEER
jgi:hypothetical protein